MRKTLITVFTMALLVISSIASALPFNIIPKAGTQLPTVVYTGKTATAYYTVVNRTLSQRNNNYVQSLPPNVTQVTTGGTYPDTCSQHFNLAANKQSGDSCTLQLTISGAVSSSDPNPQHALFVCFPGGLSCAGTYSPLNVSSVLDPLQTLVITPVNANIHLNGTQQYTAIGTYANGSTADLSSVVNWKSSNTSIATISPTGFASGVGIGTSQISATYGVDTSNTALLSVDNPLVSIALSPTSSAIRKTVTQQFTATGTYANGTTQNITTLVTWTSGTPATATINATTGLATAVNFGTTSIGATYPGYTIAPVSLTVAAFAYVTNVFNNTVAYCVISQTDGTLSNCNTTGNVTFSQPSGIVIDPTYKFAYIGSNNSGTIYYCNINADATLSNCQTTSCGTNHTWALAINTPTSTLWASDITGATGQGVYYCGISSTTGGTTYGPSTPGGSQTQVSALGFNATGSVIIYGQVAFQQIYSANINGNPPTFGSNGAAIGTNISLPGGVAINSANTYAYIGNFNSSNVYQCTFNSATTFSTCNTTASIFGSTAIALSDDETHAYIAFNSSNLDICSVNPTTGALSGCTGTGTGLTSPRWIALLTH